jgi:DNA-binding cell septation regulator SpoVG
MRNQIVTAVLAEYARKEEELQAQAMAQDTEETEEERIIEE